MFLKALIVWSWLQIPCCACTMASHFVLASSHSLRRRDLFDIIPGLKFLKKQNSPLRRLSSLQCYLQPPKEVQDFLNTLTFSHDQRP